MHQRTDYHIGVKSNLYMISPSEGPKRERKPLLRKGKSGFLAALGTTIPNFIGRSMS